MKGMKVRLPAIGHIKIGDTDTSGDRDHPRKWDYIQITTTEKDDNDNYIIDHELTRAVAHPDEKDRDKPRIVGPCYLPMDTVKGNLYLKYGFYQSTWVPCTGDGEVANFKKSKDSHGKKVECNPETCQYYLSGKCKLTSVLQVMFEQGKWLGGVYLFKSRGNTSATTLYSQLEFYKQQTVRLVGRPVLSGIPLWLVMHKNRGRDRDGIMRTWNSLSLEYEGNINEYISFISQRVKAQVAITHASLPAEQIEDGGAFSKIAQDHAEDPEEWEGEDCDSTLEDPASNEETGSVKSNDHSDSPSHAPEEKDKSGTTVPLKIADYLGRQWSVDSDVARDYIDVINQWIKENGRSYANKQLTPAGVRLKNIEESPREYIYKILNREDPSGKDKKPIRKSTAKLDWKINKDHIGDMIAVLNKAISKFGRKEINTHLSKYGVTIDTIHTIEEPDAEAILSKNGVKYKPLPKKEKQEREYVVDLSDLLTLMRDYCMLEGISDREKMEEVMCSIASEATGREFKKTGEIEFTKDETETCYEVINGKLNDVKDRLAEEASAEQNI